MIFISDGNGIFFSFYFPLSDVNIKSFTSCQGVYILTELGEPSATLLFCLFAKIFSAGPLSHLRNFFSSPDTILPLLVGVGAQR